MYICCVKLVVTQLRGNIVSDENFFHRHDSELLLTILIFLKTSLYLARILKSDLSG